MKAILSLVLALGSSLSLALRAAGAEPSPPPVMGTPAPPPSAPAQRSASELEKLAMPIALHPDPLIAIILPAAVYPVEIVMAARFVKDTNNIPKVDEQPWDENVQAVAKFPDLISKMSTDLEWTVALGQAFLDQRKELMDTIQSLRAKAQKAGTLQTTPQQVVVVTNTVVEKVVDQQTVVVTNTVVQIQPSNPEVIYVPSYPPAVYYPPPVYAYSYGYYAAPLMTFGAGMLWGAAIANWNHCDWHGGDIDVDIDRNINRNSNRNVNRVDARSDARAGTNQKGWQPDQNRLRSSGAPSASTREARGWNAPSTAGGAKPSQRPATSPGGTRPSQQPALGASQRPSASTQPARSANVSQRPSTPQRPASSAGASRSNVSSKPSSSQGSSAFSGVGSGGSSRSYSSRGSSSRSGGGYSAGRSGGSRSGGGRGGGGRR